MRIPVSIFFLFFPLLLLFFILEVSESLSALTCHCSKRGNGFERSGTVKNRLKPKRLLTPCRCALCRARDTDVLLFIGVHFVFGREAFWTEPVHGDLTGVFNARGTSSGESLTCRLVGENIYSYLCK